MKNMARHLNMKQSLLLCTLLAGFACTALAPLTPAAFATEKDAIKVSYHIPAHLSSEEKKWYRTFQEGNMLADGWVDISKDILSRTPAAEQPEQQKNLFQLGDKIGREWAKRNDSRRINTDMLKKLTKDIEWLDRKVEETVSMDIWQYGHVIDFTDKITFDGNVYSLESNHVTQTPTELKQSVVLKRWY